VSTSESIHRRPQRGGDEVDAFSRSGQRELAWNHGDRGKIKTRHNRRVRHATRVELRSLAGAL
jgi:hypothetical protein